MERYKQRKGIVAWQLEHESVDTLGVEHSWRLDVAFVEKEVEAVRNADPSRPIMMNGFLPTSLPVRLSQWWRTRDQGDSLAVAQHLADIVGIDYYPRHALTTIGNKTVYLDGSKNPWHQQRQRQLFTWTRTHGQKLMVAEGQSEPWEAVTIPPNPYRQGCTVACLNRSLPIITPVCAGLDEKIPFMHTYFGEQSIGCSESNVMTPAISRHLLESSNMLDKTQLMKSPVSEGISRGIYTTSL